MRKRIWLGTMIVVILATGCGKKATVATAKQTSVTIAKASPKIAVSKPQAMAQNHSTVTKCAEEDNINIPISGTFVACTIEAIHPSYDTTKGSSTPDFTNCPTRKNKTYHFTPDIIKMDDDGETVFEAVREAEWWRPNGMTVSVDNPYWEPVKDIHYIRISRKIDGEVSYPQFLVLYMDGNLRLKPHPPQGVTDTCFGSSVIVGPAVLSSRPLAEIRSLKYNSLSKTFAITYRSGARAVISLFEVSRRKASVKVRFEKSDPKIPLITFRSMYVGEGNADVDHVYGIDSQRRLVEAPIMSFKGGKANEWFFFRKEWSKHNTAAPDIRVQLN